MSKISQFVLLVLTLFVSMSGIALAGSGDVLVPVGGVVGGGSVVYLIWRTICR